MNSQILEGMHAWVDALPAETLLPAITVASAAWVLSMYLLVRYRLGKGE
jgi:hypothetical protein